MLEDQIITGRWRVLTRSYVQKLFDEAPDMTDFLFDAFVNILVAAGVDLPDTDLRHAILEKFGERVTLIAQKSKELNKVMGEKVTSCELIPLYAVPDAPFDPGAMDDAVSDVKREESKGELVLCTTDLGLLRAERIKEKEGEWVKSLLLKPKVVLESGLTAEEVDTDVSSDSS